MANVLARCMAAARTIVEAHCAEMPAAELVLGSGVALVYNTTSDPMPHRLRSTDPNATKLDEVLVQPGQILLLQHCALIGDLAPPYAFIDTSPYATTATDLLEAEAMVAAGAADVLDNAATSTSAIIATFTLDGKVIAMAGVQ